MQFILNGQQVTRTEALVWFIHVGAFGWSNTVKHILLGWNEWIKAGEMTPVSMVVENETLTFSNTAR